MQPPLVYQVHLLHELRALRSVLSPNLVRFFVGFLDVWLIALIEDPVVLTAKATLGRRNTAKEFGNAKVPSFD